MQIDAAQLKNFITTLTSGVAYSVDTRASVFAAFEFGSLTGPAKCELAKFFICESCRFAGAVNLSYDADFFICHVAKEIDTWPRNVGIASRRLEHIAYAMPLAIGYDGPASSLGVLGATYLLHQLEFLFREMSGTLKSDGKFKNKKAYDTLKQQLGRELKKYKMSARVNDIVVTYQIMKLNTALLAPRIYGELDQQLPHYKMSNGKLITNIGERIAYHRHPVSHGQRSDPSFGGLFYALAMSIALYGTSLFQRV